MLLVAHPSALVTPLDAMCLTFFPLVQSTRVKLDVKTLSLTNLVHVCRMFGTFTINPNPCKACKISYLGHPNCLRVQTISAFGLCLPKGALLAPVR